MNHRAFADAEQRDAADNNNSSQDGNQRNKRAHTRILRLGILIGHSSVPLFLLVLWELQQLAQCYTKPSPGANA